MSNSGFWAKAAENFRRLQPPVPKLGVPQRQSDNGLCAYWWAEGAGDGKPWSFGNAGTQIGILFRIAAERAAVELGHAGGEPAVFFWLDLVKEAGIFYRLAPGGGEIYRVCDASAEYCLKCEADDMASVSPSRKRASNRSSDKAARAAFLKSHLLKDTRNSIAEGAGIAPSSLQRWHEGKTRLRVDNAAKLARFLGVDPRTIPN